MAFSIQQLTDDSKFSQALRFEVLEQLCPRKLVSDLLSRCHAWGERERSLNQLLIVYYVIALSLFRGLNLAAVLAHLVRGLRWLWSNPSLRLPTAAALVYHRRQLGTPVMRHLCPSAFQPGSGNCGSTSMEAVFSARYEGSLPTPSASWETHAPRTHPPERAHLSPKSQGWIEMFSAVSGKYTAFLGKYQSVFGM